LAEVQHPFLVNLLESF
jgi:serine/threonine protein kinase